MANVILSAPLRVCRICQVGKPDTEFSPRRDRACGYRKECKSCTNARMAEWKTGNPDRLQTYKVTKLSAGYKYEVDVHAQRLANKRYYAANKAKLAERYRENAARWLKQNPEKSAAKKAERRFRKARAAPAWANKFFISEAYHLAQLRTKLTGFLWEVDHIVPLKSKLVCGLHVEHNLAVIPSRENSSKGNRFWPDMP